jgi:hypothetical protein
MLVPNVRTFFVRNLGYAVVFRRRKYWDSVSRSELFLLTTFAAVNIIMIFLFLPLESFNWQQVGKRSAFAATVNVIPVSLGGRLGPIVQTLNIHRSSYLLFHHWIGRIAIIQAAIHTAIMIAIQPSVGQRALSGWVVSYIIRGSECIADRFNRLSAPCLLSYYRLFV